MKDIIQEFLRFVKVETEVQEIDRKSGQNSVNITTMDKTLKIDPSGIPRVYLSGGDVVVRSNPFMPLVHSEEEE